MEKNRIISNYSSAFGINQQNQFFSETNVTLKNICTRATRCSSQLLGRRIELLKSSCEVLTVLAGF